MRGASYDVRRPEHADHACRAMCAVRGTRDAGQGEWYVDAHPRAKYIYLDASGFPGLGQKPVPYKSLAYQFPGI